MATSDKIAAEAGVKAVVQPQKFGKERSLERIQRTWGWIFLSPWIIGFIAFYLLPIVASFAFTLVDFDARQPDQIEYIGLQNYQRLLSDPLIKTSLWVTLRYAAIALPLSILIPLGLAALLNSRHLWAKRLFRTLFYMPYIVPIISITYIFNGFLNAQSGWLNRFLESIGIGGPVWLYDPLFIYPALVMIGIWGTGNYMLLMLASLQTVPTELYEAAKVDGANWWVRFRHITFPMISPVVFYCLVLSVVGLFRYFEIPYILSRGTGQPNNLTLFYNVYFYRQTFRNFDLSYGATMAWLLFGIAMLVTILLFVTSRYWVFYAGDKDE